MRRTPVDSSNIRSIGYEAGTLEIEFHSGGVYQYYGVSVSVYNELMNASSHGKYFHRNIKDVYDWKKMR